MSFAGTEPKAQGAINTAALSGVNSDNAELKHMVQQSGAENALGNHKASESLDCIVISDSDEESPDRRELLRNSSNTDSSEAPSAPGEPEDQTRNTSNDAAATLPAQPPGQRHLSSPNLRDKCVVCKQLAPVDDLRQCGSCDKLLHEACAARLPLPLSQYCFFCKACGQQPHQRGALLEALAAKGKQGGTEKELRELVQKREAACMETNTDTTITRLVGANKTVQQELNKMMPNSGRRLAFQIEMCSEENTSRFKQRYRLKLTPDEWDQSESQQAHVNKGIDKQDDAAQQPSEASGRGEASSSLQASMQPYGKAAAVEDKAVTHAANTYFLQEPDSRSPVHPAQSAKRKAGCSPQSQSAVKRNTQNRTSAKRFQDMEAEMLQVKQDNHLLREQVQAQQRQIAVLQQPKSSNQQSASTGYARSTTDISSMDVSAPRLLAIVKQVLQSLRKYKPAELCDVSPPPDPMAENVEQLLRSLGPQLQGEDFYKWQDAVGQLKEPLQDLTVTQSDLHHRREVVKGLKQSCLSGQFSASQGLIAQLERLLNSWQGWLNSIASYETRAAELKQLQKRDDLCVRARLMIRPG